MEDFTLIEKLAHFNRERIHERVVHASGQGGHGYFEVTKVQDTTFLLELCQTQECKQTLIDGSKGSESACRLQGRFLTFIE